MASNSGWTLFVSEHIHRYGTLKNLSVLWRGMSEAEKQASLVKILTAAMSPSEEIPKKKLTGWNLFVREQNKVLLHLEYPLRIKVISALWQQLSLVEKAGWKQAALAY